MLIIIIKIQAILVVDLSTATVQNHFCTEKKSYLGIAIFLLIF